MRKRFLFAFYAVNFSSMQANSMFSALNLGLTVFRFVVSVWNSDRFLTAWLPSRILCSQIE